MLRFHASPRRPCLAWLRRAALAGLAALAPALQAVPHHGTLPAMVVAQRDAPANTGIPGAAVPRAPGPTRNRPPAPLGVPQVHAPGEATPTVPAASSPRVPPRALLAPAEPGVLVPSPRQTLAPAAVRPGPASPAPAASAVRPGTSAACTGQPGARECLLPGPKPADWHQQTGVEIDPVTGAKLVPGVHLNPPKAP